MTKQTMWNNAYIAKAYDRIGIVIPKGRKDDLNAKMKAEGKTINGYLNTALREYLGVSEEEWGITQKPPH